MAKWLEVADQSRLPMPSDLLSISQPFFKLEIGGRGGCDIDPTTVYKVLESGIPRGLQGQVSNSQSIIE
jgi:hypothetical protein